MAERVILENGLAQAPENVRREGEFLMVESTMLLREMKSYAVRSLRVLSEIVERLMEGEGKGGDMVELVMMLLDMMVRCMLDLFETSLV